MLEATTLNTREEEERGGGGGPLGEDGGSARITGPTMPHFHRLTTEKEGVQTPQTHRQEERNASAREKGSFSQDSSTITVGN